MSKIGAVMRLEQGGFTTEDWQLITNTQAMRSLLKILRLSDKGYRMLSSSSLST